MPVVMPRRVRDVLGEEAAQEMAEWVEAVVKERTVLRDEYREVLSRLDRLEADVSDLKTEVRDLRREMNERFDRLYDRMLVQNRWLVGSIALFGTVVSILLGIGQLMK